MLDFEVIPTPYAALALFPRAPHFGPRIISSQHFGPRTLLADYFIIYPFPPLDYILLADTLCAGKPPYQFFHIVGTSPVIVADVQGTATQPSP